MSSGDAINVGGVSADLDLTTNNFEQKLAVAQGELKKTASEITQLREKLAAGTISISDYTERIQGLPEKLEKWRSRTDELRESLQTLREAQARNIETAASMSGAADNAATATVRFNTSMAGASKASSKASNDMLTLGNSIDDLQYVSTMGIRPIVNNIMQISPALGIAMIGVDQLIKHWGELRELAGLPKLDESISEVERLEKAVKKLGDESRNSIAAYHGLLQAERDQKAARSAETAVEGIKHEESKVDQESGKAVKDVIARTSDGNKLTDAIVKSYQEGGQLGQFNPKLKAAKDKLDAMVAETAKFSEMANRGERVTDPAVLDRRLLDPGNPAHYVERNNSWIKNGGITYQQTFGLLGMAPVQAEYEKERVNAEKNARLKVAERVNSAIGGNKEDINWLAAMANQFAKNFPEGLGKKLGDARIAGPMKQLEKDLKKGEELSDAEFEAQIAALNKQGKQIEDEVRAEFPELFKSAGQKHKEDVTERAKGFEGGSIYEVGLEGKLTREGMKASLKQTGDSEEVAERLVDDVMEKVLKDIDQKVKTRARNFGITMEGARQELLDEADDKKQKRLDAEERKKEAVEARKRAEANRIEAGKAKSEREARELIPTGELQARDAIRRARLGGATPEKAESDAAKALAKRLEELKMAPDAAKDAAARIAGDADKDLQRDMAQRFYHEQDKMGESRNSQIIKSADMASKIQESIGGGDKHLKEMMDHNKKLEAVRLLLQDFKGKKLQAVLQ